MNNPHIPTIMGHFIPLTLVLCSNVSLESDYPIINLE